MTLENIHKLFESSKGFNKQEITAFQPPDTDLV
jgi:hypothetical protein